MRIPWAKDGFGVMSVATVILLVVGWAASWLTPWAWVVIAILWGWGVSFFRDPARDISREPNVLYAPADGKITEVVELENHPVVGGPCVRVRIFLSLFNVHINRMPCAASVTSVEFKPGEFLNALKPESAERNESNTLILQPRPPLPGPMVVRQIAGLVARTIVCRVRPGDSMMSGERIGMIKFGSGTELIFPKADGIRVLVSTGSTVRAGLTKIAELDTIL